MVLAGDIGGTKAVLALFKQEKSKLLCVYKQTYLCAEYQSLSQVLTSFLLDASQSQVSSVCLGVAGPIVNGDCFATNLKWNITCREISEILVTDHVCLINDLEAAAWGVLSLPENTFIELNPDAEQAQGNVAVLAAGTGLGEAIMHWDGEIFRSIATEGGHTDFAPANEQEAKLLNFLRKKHPDHVSYERLVSGEGLYNIYQFFKQSGSVVSPAIEDALREGDPPAIIGEAGVSGSDALSQKALIVFCQIYGAEAGNLALKCLPYGGIYLAGGIAPKILPMLQEGCFLQSFLSKGRYQNILKKMPVRVCLDQEAGLLGACEKALALIH
jgi:glucokinase